MKIIDRIKRGPFKYWYLTLYVLLSAFCYFSVFIPPSVFWPAIFSSFAIPAVPIVSSILYFTLLIIRKSLTIFPLVVLISGLPFVWLTISFNPSADRSEKDLSVLSFNAKLFRAAKTYEKFSQEAIEWAVQDTSDVKCFQEYSTNSRWKGLNVTNRIAEKEYKHFIYAPRLADSEHNPGMAIFSRYPMIDSGFVWKERGSMNGIIFADILKEKDTIRIYNVHLESMRLELYRYKSKDDYFYKIRDLISRLKNGAMDRSNQVDLLISHAASSPFPFVICGDFNETPYSYNYFKLRSAFSNTFEEIGNGFGFSFNGVLFFLRIDHHFYGSDIKPKNYSTDRSIDTSDHFPTRGFYQIGE